VIAKLLQIRVQEYGWWGWLEGQCAKLRFYWKKADGQLIYHTILHDSECITSECRDNVQV